MIRSFSRGGKKTSFATIAVVAGSVYLLSFGLSWGVVRVLRPPVEAPAVPPPRVAVAVQSAPEPVEPAIELAVGPEVRLAVLPFKDKGPSIELAPLGDALVNMLIGDLSQYQGLHVAERGRVEQFLGETNLGQSGLVDDATAQRAGRELAADYLLIGSFSTANQQFTVETALVETAKNRPVVTWKLSRPVNEIFTLQGDLSKKLLTALRHQNAARVRPPEARPGPSPTVAVLWFQDLSPSVQLRPMEAGFADILQTQLAALKEVRLVERQRLQSVLKEQQLSLSGAVNDAKLVQVGKLLKAERLIYGSFIELGGQLRLEVRLSDTATASILKAETAFGPTAKFADLLEDLALRLVRDLAITPPSDALERVQAATPTRKLEAVIHYTAGEYAYQYGRFVESARDYERVLLLEPDNRRAEQRRVRGYIYAADYPKTIEAGLEALGKPFTKRDLWRKYEIYRFTCQAYYYSGRHQENLQLCQKALAEIPAGDEEIPDLRWWMAKSLFYLKREPEAIALFRANLDNAQGKSKPEAYARALVELHQFLYGSQQQAVDSRACAKLTVETLDRILEAAKDQHTHDWEKWGKSYLLPTIVWLNYRVDNDGYHEYLKPDEQIAYLRRSLEVFGWIPQVDGPAHFELARLLEQQDKSAEAQTLYQQVLDKKDLIRETVPYPIDRTYAGRNQWDDLLIEARYRLAYLQGQDRSRGKEAEAAYQALLREEGIAHPRGADVARALSALGQELVLPEKAALIIGGGSNGLLSYRKVLAPLGYTVHGCGQYRFTAANLAPYRLVILARQGGIALEPSEVMALRSYVATGGSLLVLASPTWGQSYIGILNPLLSFFGVQAQEEMEQRLDSTFVAEHPITRGIPRTMARGAVGLDVPAGTALVKSGERTLLAAVPYRRGRVVVASFAQWFVPDDVHPYTDLLGHRPPLETGIRLQLPLLRNVIGWLTEEGPERPQGSSLPKAFRTAQLTALQVQYRVQPRTALTEAMDRLVSAAKPGQEQEEALLAAGDAFLELAWFRTDGRYANTYMGWENAAGLPEPAPRYFQQFIDRFPKSELLPYAQWRRVECARFQKINEVCRRGGLEQDEKLPSKELLPLYAKVQATPGSVIWAWSQLQLARAHWNENDPKQALVHYREVADRMGIGPEKALSLFEAALCEEALGHKDEADRYYKILVTMPTDLYWYSGDDHKAWGPRLRSTDGYRGRYFTGYAQHLAVQRQYRLNSK